MPAKSKAQLRFMAGVASGNIRSPGLSREEAEEYVHATHNAKSLPNRIHRKLTRRKK